MEKYDESIFSTELLCLYNTALFSIVITRGKMIDKSRKASFRWLYLYPSFAPQKNTYRAKKQIPVEAITKYLYKAKRMKICEMMDSAAPKAM